MEDIIHHKGKVVITNINLTEAIDKDVGGIIKRESCVNRCNTPITVVSRNGLKWVVPNIPNGYTKEFILRTEYTIPYQSFDCMLRLFSSIDPEKNCDDYEELLTLKEIFFRLYESHKFKSMRLVVDTIVHQEAIKRHQSVYVSSKDLMLTMVDPSAALDHPFSQGSLLVEKYEKLIQNNSGINFFIEIIDNDDELADRYLYLAKQVFKIIPHRDQTRQSGVYFGIGEVDGTGKTLKDIKRFDLDKASGELGLYKTREEAISAGDVKSLRQEEIAKLTHTNNLLSMELQQTQQLLKSETEQMKAEYAKQENTDKRTLLELQTRLAEVEKQNKIHQLDSERQRIDADLRIQELKAEYDAKKMRLEDLYNARNYERKDSSEIIKFIPAAIAVGLGIWVAILKAKT
jgi:hypothetical protein